MLSLTIRLDRGRLHLVRRLSDCDACGNQEAHVRLERSSFPQSAIVLAAHRDASALAILRQMAEQYGQLRDTHRRGDSEVLDRIRWLLATERLVAVECVKVLPNVASASPAPAPPRATAPPRARATPAKEPTKTWVEIELVDDAQKPVANRRYRVKVPEGTVYEGSLDAQGRARISGIDPGSCEITFPEIDAREWASA